jgi:hypothetical protein
MLVGFVVGCAIIHVVGGQPAAMPSPVQMAVQSKPPQVSQPKFMQQMRPMPARASSVVANAEPDAGMGRREMLAGAFGLAMAASNRAAAAQQGPKDEKVFGKEYVEPALPPAGDYTAYNKVVTVARPSASAGKVAEAEPSPGSVEVQPLLLPGIVAFSAFFTAAVPALLSPGETAKNAQDAQRKKVFKGNKQQKTAPAKKKGGLFR